MATYHAAEHPDSPALSLSKGRQNQALRGPPRKSCFLLVFSVAAQLRCPACAVFYWLAHDWEVWRAKPSKESFFWCCYVPAKMAHSSIKRGECAGSDPVTPPARP